MSGKKPGWICLCFLCCLLCFWNLVDARIASLELFTETFRSDQFILLVTGRLNLFIDHEHLINQR